MIRSNFNILIILCFLLSSCGVKKHIPEGKTLYDGAEIIFEEGPKLTDKSAIESSIFNSLYPLPNRKLLGLVRFNLWVYFAFDKNKEKWFAEKLYERFAEEPIYLEDIDRNLMERIVQKKLQDYGHFKSKVKSEVDPSSNIGNIKYRIQASIPTIVSDIKRPDGTSEIDSLISNYAKLQIKKGAPYKLIEFEIERNKLAKRIRSRGYFDFGAQDIFYLVDTSQYKKVNITMRIKKPAQDSIYRKFHIRDINVYTTSGATGTGSMTNAKKRIQYKGLNIYQDFDFINKKALHSNVLIESGNLFSVEDYNLTLSRLLNLNIFKYVNIEYKKAFVDSLDVDILLTPNLYLGAQYDIEASTSDRAFLGSSVSVSFNNNNTF